MRKVLLTFLIIILLVVFGIMAANGISIGNFEIPSIGKILQKNNDLDVQIGELDSAIQTDYNTAKASLNTSLAKLQSSKQKYQDTITYSTEDEIKSASQTEKYKLDFLWTTIGLYATKYDVTMQANVSYGSIAGLYNISFVVSGEYLSISEFVYAIENDSKLGFRIEDFILLPYADDTLQASFVIRNVAIDEDSLTSAAVLSNDQVNTTTQQAQETRGNATRSN